MATAMNQRETSRERAASRGRRRLAAALASTTRMNAAVTTIAMSALVVFGGGCRGTASESAPIHPNPNMDDQAYVQAQEPHPFFADGRGMRPPVEGTVRRGATADERAAILREDGHYWRGRMPGRTDDGTEGAYATKLPVRLTAELLERGRERYAVYCAMCHDATGGGDGPVIRRGMVEPPPYDDQRVLAMPVGQLYDVITNGVRNMPAYAAQIPVADRWAIVAWVRALQVARTAKLEDVPADVKREKGWGER